MLNFDEIKELIELVAENRLDGLEIERAGFRLSITGQVPETPAAPAAAANLAPSAAETAGAAQPEQAPAASAEEPQQAEEGGVPEGAHVVTSPIVGTFYAAPSPDTDPFVQTGDRVKKGQVLCIVEAMKLMNEIESDVDGVVVEVYPKNSQPVEFGEQLFVIQPS